MVEYRLDGKSSVKLRCIFQKKRVPQTSAYETFSSGVIEQIQATCSVAEAWRRGRTPDRLQRRE